MKSWLAFVVGVALGAGIATVLSNSGPFCVGLFVVVLMLVALLGWQVMLHATDLVIRSN